MTAKQEERLQQAFIALTARWRKNDGRLAIGVTRQKFKAATEMTDEELEEFLEKLRIRLGALGMELVEYLYQGEVWYAVRSGYVCPSELTSEDEAVLAMIIFAAENSNEQAASVESLRKKLVAGKYFSAYHLERILKNLEYMGYIHRKNKVITYSPRTMLEFSEEARKHIAEESSRFIF